ncbi:MAG: cell division protein ZapA [Giesbergeria sp.]|nr:cell division protein ZapA [Giesbergeria sp.]
MKQIEVQIMQQSYLLSCPEGRELHLLEAVERIDGAMTRIRDAGKVRTRERIAVLAALNMAFDIADREASALAALAEAKAAQEKAAKVQAAKDKAVKEQAAKDEAAREQAEQERAAAALLNPVETVDTTLGMSAQDLERLERLVLQLDHVLDDPYA